MNNQYILKKVPLSYVNLRAQPTSSSADLGDLYPGAVVEMLYPDVNGWAQVAYQGIVGYISLQGGQVVFAPYDPDAPAPTDFKLSLPVDPPGIITQAYGANPEYYAQFGLAGHEGIDYAAATGAPIYAASSGTIKLLATDDGKHNYGTHIRLTHPHQGDTYETIYAHLSAFAQYMKVGQVAIKGQLIGYADSTGNSTGSHLHFTLKKNGIIVDPTPHLKV